MQSSSNTPAPSTGSAGCVMRDMIRRAEKFYPDKTAVVCGTQRWTYREFASRVRKLAGALSTLGVARGDRVAVMMLNCHRYLELYAACFELGAIIVPLNVRLAPPEVIYTVNDAGAILLIVDETFLPLVEGIRSSLSSVGEYIYAGHGQEQTRVLPTRMHDYEHLLGQVDELRQPPTVREEDIAGLFYTSGTTGNAKGVMLTNRNLCANALQGFALRMPPADSVFLHSTPMFHLAGGPTAWIYFRSQALNVLAQSICWKCCPRAPRARCSNVSCANPTGRATAGV